MNKGEITTEQLLYFLNKMKNMYEVLGKKTNKAIREYYNQDVETLRKNVKLNKLYPNLIDPEFNHKISKRKEFNDLKFDEFDKDIVKESEKLCNSEFELSVHQIFVRNFLSFLTPYNSLLLYHGLGTGKTCSAITVCEEMRDYMKQIGIKKKIIIVASPNVQDNFKTQLFDERKLKQTDGIWNIKACTSNKFLREINPMNMKGLKKERIILQIKKIIRQSYVFMGYIEFSNYITNIKNKYTIDDKEDIKTKISAIKKEFSNRLIVIDEVHNLRISGDSPNKKIGQNLLDMVKYSDTLKLLLLSATPMFNNHKEIVWLLNLMNINDGRPTVELAEIFDSAGNLKIEDGKEVGKELLINMMNGYVSYVRGENPYTFPYRIFPKEFASETSIKNETFEYPDIQINGKRIVQGIEHIDLFMNDIGEYQRDGYEYAIQTIRRDIPDDKNLETGMGWQNVEIPLQTLNFVYPNITLDKKMRGEDVEINPRDYVGREGLHSVMLYNESKKRDFKYSDRTLDKYGEIFAHENIGKYSKKLENFITNVKNSKGIVMIYSQYIDGGCVPIALALEQIGITRYDGRNLFEKEPVPKIDALTMKPKSSMTGDKFKAAKYVMITGDVNLSPNNAKDVKAATNESNKHGEDVKVIIISKAGTEGIDFNCIRQIHIMEPWYNMSRIEQTIGRAVRFRSHCNLPFVERNTEIYLYGTYSYDDENIEPIDLYIYRNAEMKAVQVGKISRIMKENAIDCYLNTNLNKLDVTTLDTSVKLSLSNGKIIDYAIGDKPYTQICDYMDSCSYTCKPNIDREDDDEIIMDTYDENFITLNIEKVMQKIKNFYKNRFISTKKELILNINQVKSYPLIQIDAALDYLIKDKNEFLIDMFGNTANLINSGEYYMLQPLEVSDEKISRYDRMKPIDYKPEKIKIVLEPEIKEYLVEGVVEKKKVVKNKKYEELLENITTKYIQGTTEQEIKRGEKDWYKYCYITITRLRDSIDVERLKSFVVHHIFDSLDITDKKLIIENVFNKDSLSLVEGIMKDYINQTITVTNNDKNAFILVDNKKSNLYIIKDNKLVKTEPLDFQDFSSSLRRKIINPEKYNFIVGFMANIRGSKDIIFKTKEVDLKRNAGARCDQAGKKTIIKILNKITMSSRYTSESTKVLKTPQLCSEQEFLLRYYQSINKDEKQWFLNHELSILNQIETLNR